MTAKTRLIIGFKDDLGLERDNMEDAAGWSMAVTNMDVRRKGAIFVVADGVGGIQAGEVASNRAVKTILKEYYAAPYEDTGSSLRYAINIANDVIYKEAREANKESMATTVICAVIRDGILTLANVGDSRAYLLRSGMIRQLSEDHSWVNEQIRSGALTPVAAKTNPYRNVITRSLGNKPKVEADIQTLGALLNDDRLLLCSDGLYEGVGDADMIDVIQRLPSTQAAEELVDMANRAGGSDNVTVLIIEAHVEGIPEEQPVSIETPVEPINAAEEPATQPSPRPEAGAIEDGPSPEMEAVETESQKTNPLQPIEITGVNPPDLQKDSELEDTQELNRNLNTQKVGPFLTPPAEIARPTNGQTPPPVDWTPPISQPSTVLYYRTPPEDSTIETESEVSMRRGFLWEWVVDYQASGIQEPFQREQVIKLPNGKQLTLGMRISKTHFVHSITKKTYNYPLAFDLSMSVQGNEKHLTKSKGLIGVGFYNSIKDRLTLQAVYQKNYEIIMSDEGIFLLNKADPLVFATIDLVEFESIHHHQVEMDFLTILQVKVRFHVQL